MVNKFLKLLSGNFKKQATTSVEAGSLSRCPGRRVYWMLIKEFQRRRTIKKMLGYLAYTSLLSDISITLVTIVSIWAYNHQLYNIQLVMNYASAIIMVASIALFLALIYLSNYRSMLYGVVKLRYKINRSLKRYKAKIKYRLVGTLLMPKYSF